MQNPDHDRQWFPVGRAVSLKVTISMPFTLGLLVRVKVLADTFTLESAAFGSREKVLPVFIEGKNS